MAHDHGGGHGGNHGGGGGKKWLAFVAIGIIAIMLWRYYHHHPKIVAAPQQQHVHHIIQTRVRIVPRRRYVHATHPQRTQNHDPAPQMPSTLQVYDTVGPFKVGFYGCYLEGDDKGTVICQGNVTHTNMGPEIEGIVLQGPWRGDASTDNEGNELAEESTRFSGNAGPGLSIRLARDQPAKFTSVFSGASRNAHSITTTFFILFGKRWGNFTFSRIPIIN